jgi:hypothetical protein
MNDWDNVRRHPVLWAFGIFVLGFPIGFAIVSTDGGSRYEATVVGIGTGLVCTLVCLSKMGIGGERLALPPLRRFTVFNGAAVLVGLTVVVVGTITGNWKTALAGLPLIGFGVGMTLARHLVLRRRP